MIKTLRMLRADIIEALFKIDDPEKLKALYKELSLDKNQENLLFMEAVRPVKKQVNLAQVMEEQEYYPINYTKFRERVDDIEWEESLEELLDAVK